LAGSITAGVAAAQDEVPVVRTLLLEDSPRAAVLLPVEENARWKSRFPLQPEGYLPLPLPPPRAPMGVPRPPGRLVSYDPRARTVTVHADGTTLGELADFGWTLGSTGARPRRSRPLALDAPAPRNFSPLSEVADPQDHPWRVHVKLFMSLTDQDGIRRGYVCSGTLIDPKHALTAGHCVYFHEDAENACLPTSSRGGPRSPARTRRIPTMTACLTSPMRSVSSSGSSATVPTSPRPSPRPARTPPATS
jgi:hypothetical protein